MHNSTKIFLLASFGAIGLFSCKKTETTKYGVTDVSVYEDKARKNKLKSEGEYISILHTNLFQKPVSPTELYKAQSVIYSIGDKSLAYEVVLSNFFNRSGVVIPTMAEMRSNIDSFVVKTYLRFFLREPSEAEKSYFNNFIKSNPNLVPELVYTAFASSDEYAFY